MSRIEQLNGAALLVRIILMLFDKLL